MLAMHESRRPRSTRPSPDRRLRRPDPGDDFAWDDAPRPRRPASGGDDRPPRTPRRPAAPAAGPSPDTDRARRRPPRRLPIGRGGAVALAVAALLLVLVVAALVVRASHDGKALPGTRVAGVDVGGASKDEIVRRLRPLLDPARPLLLRAGGRELRLAPAQAGYRLDLDATARAAVDAGRDGILGGLPATLTSLVGTRRVAVRATVAPAALRGAAKRLAARIDRDPFPGALDIDPATHEVTTSPSRPGQAVDVDALARGIRGELLDGGRGPLDVPQEAVDAVPGDRLRELAGQAERYLRAPLRITGAGAPLELGADELARILALEGREGGRRARLGVGEAQMGALVARVAARGDRPARNARPTAPATGAIETGKGDVSWRPRRAEVGVVPARTGRTVRRDALATAIRRAVRDGEHTVRVPMATAQPTVTTEAARKVDSLIGSFTTPYVAGQPRVTNIQRMARTIDGTVIPVGGTFSLNGLTGERTTDKGYVEAPFIAGNKIEPSVGGGVSQFSTTMYNAAFFAGLQLDAHRAHSLYIDRYPPGRESTLNFPDIDLKWTNDTQAPVLVRTSYDSAGVTVTLYGDNGGRRVTATAGERQPVDGGNFQITVTRTIRYADGRTVRQPTTTRYENEVTEEEPQE